MTTTPNLDLSAIERLRRLGGDKFLREMIVLFLDYGAKKVAEAVAAQSAGDLAAVAKAVHPIKSSAGNVGASQVQALATRLETQAKDGEATALPTGVAELTAAFAAVSVELKALLTTLPTPANPD